MKKTYKQLEKELERIKQGIKRCEGTMIIDGGDMYDWGWTTIKQVNRELYKKGMKPFSWIDNHS